MKDIKKIADSETTSSENKKPSNSHDKKEDNSKGHHKVKRKVTNFENLIVESKKITNPKEVVSKTKITQWKETKLSIADQINNLFASSFPWFNQTDDSEISQDESISTNSDSNLRRNPNNKRLKMKQDGSKSCSKAPRFRSNFIIATSSKMNDDPAAEPESTDVTDVVIPDVEESTAESDPTLPCKKCESNRNAECQIKLQEELERLHPKYVPQAKCELCKYREGKCKDIDPDEESVDSMEIANENFMKELEVLKNLGADDIKYKKITKLENIQTPLPRLAGEQLDLPPCCRESLAMKKIDKSKSLSTYKPIEFSLPKDKTKLSCFQKIKISVTSVSTFKPRETKSKSPYNQIMETIAPSIESSQADLEKDPCSLRQSGKKTETRSPYKKVLGAVKMDDIKLSQETDGDGKCSLMFNNAANKVINVFKKKEIETIECKPTLAKPPLGKPALDTKKEKSPKSKAPKRKPLIVKGTINTSPYKRFLGSLSVVEKKEKVKKILEDERRLECQLESRELMENAPCIAPSKPVKPSPYNEVFNKVVKDNEERLRKDKLAIPDLKPTTVDQSLNVTQKDINQEFGIKDPDDIQPKVEKPVRIQGEPYVNPIPMPLPRDETEVQESKRKKKEKKKKDKKKKKRKGKKDSANVVKTENDDQTQEEYKAPIETKKAAPLPPGPLGEDALHLRYMYENMWYNSMFERLIGGYPSQSEKESQKLTAVVAKLQKSTKGCFSRKDKVFSKKKAVTSEEVEVRFNRDVEANMCNCPNTVCICIGRPKPKTRFFLRNGLPARSFNSMMFDLCGRSRKKSLHASIMDKLKFVSPYDNFTATSTDVKDVGPDVCMPRCAAYYKDNEQFTFKSMLQCFKKKKGQEAGKTQASLAKKEAEEKEKKAAEEAEELAKQEEAEEQANKETEEAMKAKKEAEMKALEEEKKKKEALEEDVGETNEFFSTRLCQTEETEDGVLQPDHFSHVIYGLPTYQEIRDIDGTNLQITPVCEGDGDILDQPSIIDKVVNLPIIQKHISSMKRMYSSVLGIELLPPNNRRTILTQTVEEEKPVCYPRERMKKMTAMIKAMQAKDAAKQEEIRRQTAVEEILNKQAQDEDKKKEEGVKDDEELTPEEESVFDYEENMEEHFKSFQLRPSEEIKGEDFPTYKLCPQTTKHDLEEDIQEEFIEKMSRKVLSIPEPDSGTSWVQKDDFAHRRADNCSKNKVAFDFSDRIFKANRTDTSNISSQPGTANERESTHSSLFYVDVGKDLILKKLGERTTREEREKRFSTRKRNDQKTANKKQQKSKTAPDFSSLMICGSKLASGSSYEEKQNYSYQSRESQETSYGGNLSARPVGNATMKSDTDSLMDDVFEFGDNNDRNKSDTFESIEDFKDDSSSGAFSDTSSDVVESKSKKHIELGESSSNMTIVANRVSINTKHKTCVSNPKKVKPSKIMELVTKSHNPSTAKQIAFKQGQSSNRTVTNDSSKHSGKSKNIKYKKSFKRIVPKKNSSSENSHLGSENNVGKRTSNDEMDSSANSSDENNGNDYKSMLISWINDTKSYCSPMKE